MPLPAQLRALVDFYVNRLAYQYRTKQKARDTIAIYTKQMVADGFAQDVQNAFDVPTAVGAQLDIIGKYVGVPRNIGTPVTPEFFNYSDDAGTIRANGFTDYLSDINRTPEWFSYNFSAFQNTDLNDEQYRQVIAFKIILNSSDGTLYSIQNFLQLFFNGAVTVVDNKDMTLTYSVGSSLTLPISVLQSYLPKPMGVGINIIESGSRITFDGDPRVTFDGDNRILNAI